MSDRIREKLIVTKEEARDIVCGDHDDYDVISNKIINLSRWNVRREVIIKRLSDGKFFKENYSEGATEHQDEIPFEYSEPEFTEVFLTTKTIQVYE